MTLHQEEMVYIGYTKKVIADLEKEIKSKEEELEQLREQLRLCSSLEMDKV